MMRKNLEGSINMKEWFLMISVRLRSLRLALAKQHSWLIASSIVPQICQTMARCSFSLVGRRSLGPWVRVFRVRWMAYAGFGVWMHIFSVGATIAKLWVLHGFAVCSHSMRSALVKQINELCCQPWLSPVLKSQGCYIYIYMLFFLTNGYRNLFLLLLLFWDVEGHSKLSWLLSWSHEGYFCMYISQVRLVRRLLVCQMFSQSCPLVWRPKRSLSLSLREGNEEASK